MDSGRNDPTRRYDAFMSYSHAADDELAPAVQAGLRRLAKPLLSRSGLRIFRDQTGLSVNTSLWTSICEAMDGSEWFVLLASPDAAGSDWVGREIQRWVATHDPARILPVLTSGTWVWDDEAADFDWPNCTAVHPALRGVFKSEPRHLDMTWARGAEQLTLRNGRFRDQIAELAAPIHGRSKDEIEGEDVRQQRRARRLVVGALIGLMALTVTSVVGGGVALASRRTAVAQRQEAQRQTAAALRASRISLSRELAATSSSALTDGNLDVALLLAAESAELDENVDARSSMYEALHASEPATRLLEGLSQDITHVAVSDDGGIAAGSDAQGNVAIWKRPTGQLVALLDSRHLFPGATAVGAPALVIDSAGTRLAVFTPDAGLSLVDTASGTVVDRLSAEATGFPGNPFGMAGGVEGAFDESGTNLVVFASTGFVEIAVAADALGSVSTFEYPDLGAGGPPDPSAIQEFHKHLSPARLSPDGSLLAAAGPDGLIVWATDTPGPPAWTIPRSGTDPVGLAFVGELNVRTLGAAGELLTWDLSRRSVAADVGLPVQPQRVLAVDPSLRFAAVGPAQAPDAELPGDAAAFVAVRDVESGATLVELPARTNLSTALSGRGVLIAHDSGWGSSAADITFSAMPPRGAIDLRGSNGSQIILLSGDGSVAATRSESEGVLGLHDTITGKQLGVPAMQRVARKFGSSPLLALSHDGAVAAASEDLRAVTSWRVDDGKSGVPVVVGSDLVTMALSRDGTSLATIDGQTNPTISLWDLRSGKRVTARCPKCEPWAIAMLPEGGGVVVAETLPDGQLAITVHRASDLKRVGSAVAIEGTVSDLSVSPDGAMLACTDLASGHFQVWSLRGREPVLLVAGDVPAQADSRVAFDPASKLVASATTTGVSLWDLASGQRLATDLSPPRSPDASADTPSYPVAFSDDGSRVLWASAASSIGDLASVDRFVIDTSAHTGEACRRANRLLSRTEIRAHFAGTGFRPTACS